MIGRWALHDYHDPVMARLAAWQQEDFGPRLWAKDPTLWSAEPQPELTDRLGWLTLPAVMPAQIDDIRAFAGEVREAGIQHVVLLGMGGSSLAPEVFAHTMGSAPGYPELLVLDSTHPGAVTAVDEAVDPATTLFLVSSKSGTTLEPLSFFAYFWARTAASVTDPGRHFAAVTDAGSRLQTLAADRGFRRVFEAIPDVGGRYSALTAFGLVPAALIGVDIGALLDGAAGMADRSGPEVPAGSNPGLVLGAALGELAGQGRDKATFLVSPGLAAYPGWAEQLVAESTGKDGTGILPVAGEPIGAPDAYGADRFFIYLGLDGDEAPAALDALERAGHPVARFRIDRPEDLGAEMYRAEMAVAAAGSVLGIHPFNQPDVQLAKELARRAMAGELSAGEVRETRADDPDALRASVGAWLAGAEPGDYVALQAYLRPDAATDAALLAVRMQVRDRLRLATTVGYGPRFLHSTGQYHKGGTNSGLFLQLVDEPDDRLAVPEESFTFDELVAGQALGDYQALADQDRRVLRVQLGASVPEGLEALGAAVTEALDA